MEPRVAADAGRASRLVQMERGGAAVVGKAAAGAGVGGVDEPRERGLVGGGIEFQYAELLRSPADSGDHESLRPAQGARRPGESAPAGQANGAAIYRESVRALAQIAPQSRMAKGC